MTIAERNDEFRRTGVGGRRYITNGICALPADTIGEIIQWVRWFDAFTPENDPHGEHDFGSFDRDGQTIFWKIDLYDNDLKFGSPNPEDPAVTTRVLTIMLAQEY
jgi:Protein of unknown function (DUF3768)